MRFCKTGSKKRKYLLVCDYCLTEEESYDNYIGKEIVRGWCYYLNNRMIGKFEAELCYECLEGKGRIKTGNKIMKDPILKLKRKSKSIELEERRWNLLENN